MYGFNCTKGWDPVRRNSFLSTASRVSEWRAAPVLPLVLSVNDARTRARAHARTHAHNMHARAHARSRSMCTRARFLNTLFLVAKATGVGTPLFDKLLKAAMDTEL